MDGHIIELESVVVRKDGTRLLDGIGLRVARSEFVGIVGPNGAGKTTLLNVIAGFEKFEGRLTLFRRRESWRRRRAARLRIGYVPQQFDVDPAFPISAAQAVMTGAIGRVGLFRSPGRQERERTRQLLEMMRIGHCAERPLGLLSGGERQKVSLARAILQQPDVLLLDEPTAGLDIAVQKEFMDTLGEVHRRENLTLLFVTHDFNMLPAGMRRVVLLTRGRIVFDGDVETAMSGGSLSKLFAYPLETFERRGRRFVSYG
jgi:ABC-type Mn2+/Zn2+ transport system ATPase subunit